MAYLRSSGGRWTPEGVHGGETLGLYGWRRALTGSAVGVTGEALVHLPVGPEREGDTCCHSREQGSHTCTHAHTHARVNEDVSPVG